MKTKNLMLALVVGIISVVVSGCESATPFIQVNLGPTGGRAVCGPRPQPRPQYGSGYGGGYNQPPQPYPYGGEYPSYEYGYGRPNCYVSSNRLFRNDNWIDQRTLSYGRPIFNPRFSFWGNGNSGCHRRYR